MNEQEKDEFVKDIFKIIQRSQLIIPILDGYKEIENKGNAIFIAKTDDNSIEQYLEGGQLQKDENFDEIIKEIIKETEQSMKDNNLENSKIEFLDEYKTNKFNFKLYTQDNIKDHNIIRQINAYFVEPSNNYIYEITLSAPPVPQEEANSQLTENILEQLKVILDNIKYNDQNPIK